MRDLSLLNSGLTYFYSRDVADRFGVLPVEALENDTALDWRSRRLART
jgi:hypothetical protein